MDISSKIMNNSGVWSDTSLPSVLIVCFEFLNKVWLFDDHSMVYWFSLKVWCQSPRPDLGEHCRDHCGERVKLSSHVALSREFVTEASSEVVSEEAPERDLDSRNTRTNYTFTFGPGAEVLRLLLLLCLNTSHYTWRAFSFITPSHLNNVQ